MKSHTIWTYQTRHYLGHVKRLWYLSPMRAAKVQASLRICAVSPEPPLLAHKSSESRGTFRQKARSLAPLNGWACAVKTCHDGMFEDTNSLEGAHLMFVKRNMARLTPTRRYMTCTVDHKQTRMNSLILNLIGERTKQNRNRKLQKQLTGWKNCSFHRIETVRL